MRWRSTQTQSDTWISSRYPGIGVPASQVPATGTSGPAFLFADIAANGFAPTDELRLELLTPPAVGKLQLNQDSSGSFTEAPPGSYSFTYRGFLNGVAYGDFTVSLTVGAAAQVPQGAFNVGSVTVGQTTASVPYSYTAGDATGIQYQLNSTGTIFTATASPVSLSGLTAGTAYTIRFRAVNAVGPQSTWSAAVNFTTKQLMKIVSGVLRDNTGKKLSNEPLKYFAIYDAETGEQVLRLTALSTDSAGRVSVQNAKLVEGKRYKFDWETQGGTYRMPSRVAA